MKHLQRKSAVEGKQGDTNFMLDDNTEFFHGHPNTIVAKHDAEDEVVKCTT